MNPNLSIAMAQARQQDLLRAGTGYHGGGRRIRTRRFRHKLSMTLGVRRSPATGVTGAQATPAA